MKHLESVINSGIFDEIKKADYIDAFEQLKIHEHKYRKDETIFYQGDIIDEICIVKSGSVRGEKIYPEGEIHIFSIFDEESIFGLEIATSRTREAAIDFISNEETDIVFISGHSIEHSKYNREIQKVLAYMLADDNIKMSHKIEILAERGLRNRIMIYLHVLQGKAGSNTVNIKMSREQMAQFLCVNRSALSNELNKMKRDGVIDFRGSKFTIL